MGFINLKRKLFLPLNIQRFGASLSISAKETDISSQNNTSYLNVQITITTSGGTYNNTGNAYVEGNVKVGNQTFSIPKTNFTISQNTSKVVYSGKIGAIKHNSDGSIGTATISANAYITSSTKPSGTLNVALSKIPRYAQIISFEVNKNQGIQGLTSFNVSWASDTKLSKIMYSVDNGKQWLSSSADITKNQGTFTISNLVPNTTYPVKIKVTRSDSGLDTESQTINQTTYNVNTIVNLATSIKSNETLTINIDNPSGANSNVYISVNNKTNAIVKKNVLNVTISNQEILSLLQYIPTNEATLEIIAYTVGASTEYFDKKSVKLLIVDSNPEFNNFTIKDINETTKTLTGNDNKCILNYSTAQATISVENKATAKNYGVMNKYVMSVGTNTPVSANYEDNKEVKLEMTNITSGIITIYATDNRGNSTPVTKSFTNIVDYKPLTKANLGSAIRVNEDGTQSGSSEYVNISFTGKIWVGNFGVKTNQFKNVSYRYKSFENNEWVLGTTKLTMLVDDDGNFSISQRIKGDTDLGFDISNSYTIEFTLNDELSSIIYTLNVSSGIPHIAYANNGIGFMGAYRPENGGLAQIGGKQIATQENLTASQKNLKETLQGEIGKLTDLKTSAKTNLVAAINENTTSIGNIISVTTNDNGTAIKFSNGIMICLGKISTIMGASSTWIQIGQVYGKDLTGPWEFPVAFKSIFALVGGVDGSDTAVWEAGVVKTLTAITKIKVRYPTAINYYGLKFEYIAIGTWK